MSIKKFNTINKENINIMVIEFYMSILYEDNSVSQIFKAKLGDDITTTLWQEHITTLTNFWSMIVLKDSTYKGNPMRKHFSLGLNKEMFPIWLKLFFETIDSLYQERLSKIFKEKADEIASGFIRMLSLEKR